MAVQGGARLAPITAIAAIGLVILGLGWTGSVAQEATPIAVAASASAVPPAVVARVYQGTCDPPAAPDVALSEIILQPVSDPGTPQPGGTGNTGGGATIAAPLGDLLARPHAIDVRGGAQQGAQRLACGEIAGQVEDGGVLVALSGGEEPHVVGVAWLGTNADGTTTLALVLRREPAPCPPGSGATPVTGPLTPDLVFAAEAAASGLDLDLELAIDSLDVDVQSSLLDLDLLLDGLDLRLGLAADTICLDTGLVTGLPLLAAATPAAATPAP